jgi:hypothetical protein
MNTKKKPMLLRLATWVFVGAVATGLEPATSGVTGRHSNQTELHDQRKLWAQN